MRLLLPWLLPLAMASLTIQQQAKLSFGELSAADRIVVTYTTSGCFHSGIFQLTFYRGARYRVDVEQIAWEQNGRDGVMKSVEHRRLGTVVLSDRDIVGLDSLLEFYRHMESGGCTTVEEAQIVLERKDGSSVREKYLDATCEAEDTEGVLTLGEIVRRSAGH